MPDWSISDYSLILSMVCEGRVGRGDGVWFVFGGRWDLGFG